MIRLSFMGISCKIKGIITVPILKFNTKLGYKEDGLIEARFKSYKKAEMKMFALETQYIVNSTVK